MIFRHDCPGPAAKLLRTYRAAEWQYYEADTYGCVSRYVHPPQLPQELRSHM